MPDLSCSWPVHGSRPRDLWPREPGEAHPDDVPREQWPTIWWRCERAEQLRAEGRPPHEAFKQACKEY